VLGANAWNGVLAPNWKIAIFVIGLMAHHAQEIHLLTLCLMVAEQVDPPDDLVETLHVVRKLDSTSKDCSHGHSHTCGATVAELLL
jgi:hypothetical protein